MSFNLQFLFFYKSVYPAFRNEVPVFRQLNLPSVTCQPVVFLFHGLAADNCLPPVKQATPFIYLQYPPVGNDFDRRIDSPQGVERDQGPGIKHNLRSGHIQHQYGVTGKPVPVAGQDHLSLLFPVGFKPVNLFVIIPVL